MSWIIKPSEEILKRVNASPEVSNTRKYLDKGSVGCAKKLGEEVAELVFAVACEDKERVISEAADVVYFLLLVLMSRNLDFSMVETELRRREGISGLAEKAARKPA